MKILISTTLAFFFVACSQETQNTVSEAPKQIEEKVVSKVETAVEVKPEKKQIETKQVEAAVEPVKQKVVEVKEETKAVIASKTGETIFKACIACHGQSAEKAALGKSQIIRGWSADKVANALNGYKAGTYGGVMKGVMKGQLSALNDNDIKLVSEYISKL